ncbi:MULTISPECIES: hypothetical protein [Thermomonosporaceae]|uniref:hypothetical protein n=1 Tax=Thermomonosporaceae TaxID=2012 RepID=UPI00255B3AFB|nr:MULTISPECIES: hypothetical protein [Thermomonosporaceae]MDL4777447.1 hypothetical protein [Actinomadura xylanilytica]
MGIESEGAMRYGVFRTLAGGVLLLAGAGLLSGCGAFGGSNAEQVCTDTRDAFQQYATQVRTVSAADSGQWRQAAEQLAKRIDALAAKADDAELKKALKGEADRLRPAAASIGTGDAAQLNAVISETPKRIGKACE